MAKMTRAEWRSWIRRKAERQADDYQGKTTYGLACRCGHKGKIRLYPEEAHAARFRCSKCGRTQTRDSMSCAPADFKWNDATPR